MWQKDLKIVLRRDILSGEESNDVKMNYPDIEEIDAKLSAKKNQKDISVRPKKKARRIEELDKIVEKKVKMKHDNTVEQKLQEHARLEQKKGKETDDNNLAEDQSMKSERQKEGTSLPKEGEQTERQNRIIEKTIDEEERELNRLLIEEEKKHKHYMKQQEKLKRNEEKKIAKEQKIALKTEKKLAKEKIREDKRILREERRILREQEHIEKIEQKKKLEEEAVMKRREQALKGMNYLLTVSEKYSDFYRERVSVEVKSLKQSNCKPLRERNKLMPTVNDMKEAVQVQTGKLDVKKHKDLTQELKYFENGVLHPYQVEGVTWLKILYDNGINGILADEMGLGKTIQVIALICHLLEKEISGPFLILAPLSTVPNWKSEFKRFAPKIPVVVLYGTDQERRMLYTEIKKKYTEGNFKTAPVILTSYHILLKERHFLSSLTFQYVIVDEGHKLKNHETKFSVLLRSLNSSNRLLLTGTPLHNNITELWALLNFLMPHLFTNMDTFASLLLLEDMQDEDKLIEQEEKTNMLNTIRRVLSPFMLRRLKKDVLLDLVPKKEVIIYCPMSKLQKDLYTNVIEKNLDQLLMKDKDQDPLLDEVDTCRPKRLCSLFKKYNYESPEDDSDFSDIEESLPESYNNVSEINKESKPYVLRLTMQNIVTMFRKIVNHPYLVQFPLDTTQKEKCLLVNEDLISNSGKMMVLDVLLEKLKNRGHKALIFSTTVMTLDLIEEMLIFRNHKYCRIDGSRALDERGISIDDFNKDSKILAFLLTTKAGGLGLNLAGADTCIFFDNDWNPQNDIQAESRCHRIGQTRPVMVYTLVAKNTIDEKIITCGYQKRLLEKLVIKDGRFKSLKDKVRLKTENELKELRNILKNDTDRPFREEFSNEELDRLLDRSELYEIMKGMKK